MEKADSARQQLATFRYGAEIDKHWRETGKFPGKFSRFDCGLGGAGNDNKSGRSEQLAIRSEFVVDKRALKNEHVDMTEDILMHASKWKLFPVITLLVSRFP